jgi:hypothetical protein
MGLAKPQAAHSLAEKEDFIPEIGEWAGAATFLTVARDSDVCLYT